jgi:hypothetical protein
MGGRMLDIAERGGRGKMAGKGSFLPADLPGQARTLRSVRFFDHFRRRRREPAVSGASAQTLAELEEFLRTREGVEAYLEPPTTVYATTLCLVAADGEFLRRPIKDERQAQTLCAEYRIPLYDARKVGYPKRMRDYQRGTRQQRIKLEDLPPLDIAEDQDD